MSEQEIKHVSSATGKFAALKASSATETAGGNVRPNAGKDAPVAVAQDLEVLVQRLNLANQSIGRDLRFQVDLETGRSVIQVLDSNTGEIIREIPPEQARTYISNLGDVGLRLFDGQA